MQPWLLVCMLLALVSGAVASRVQASGKQMWGGKFLSVRKLLGIDYSELHNRLAQLTEEDEPDPIPGAMCYSPVMLPDTAEYTCPDCGEKTLYGMEEASFVEWDLFAARILFEEMTALTGIEMRLDESEYCMFCGGVAEDPSLVLIVVNDSGEEITNCVTVHDLRILRGFFEGGLTYTTSNDGVLPLKPYIERIGDLLGIQQD